MKVNLPAGKYIAAVSGGVDSMVMLDLLSKQKDIEVAVAHFDHGIRVDSSKDALLVESVAKDLGLPFELGHGQLGSNASEAKARAARYDFLESVRKKHKARAILTAHHQDDLIETAIINILRGTGWRGLVAMLRNPNVSRPLAAFPKAEILVYAKAHNLQWREDETNKNQRYLRNRVRLQIIPKLKPADKRQLLRLIDSLMADAEGIDRSLAKLEPAIVTKRVIDRQAFTGLPSVVANELMASWLKKYSATEVDRRMVNRLSVAVKSARPGSMHDASDGARLEVGPKSARLL